MASRWERRNKNKFASVLDPVSSRSLENAKRIIFADAGRKSAVSQASHKTYAQKTIKNCAKAGIARARWRDANGHNGHNGHAAVK